MRSSFSSFKRHRVVGYTLGSFAAVSECFFFFPTRVGTGGSHFLGSFFCASAAYTYLVGLAILTSATTGRTTTGYLSLDVSEIGGGHVPCCPV